MDCIKILADTSVHSCSLRVENKLHSLAEFIRRGKQIIEVSTALLTSYVGDLPEKLDHFSNLQIINNLSNLASLIHQQSEQ